MTERFSNARSAFGGSSLRGLPNRAINWFKDLPSVPKLMIVGLVLLLILTVLSPIARVVAIIAFVVSAIVLAVRAIQRKPLWGWIIAVVGSVVLIPVFGGISGAIYDSGSTENDDWKRNPGGLLGPFNLGTSELEYVIDDSNVLTRTYLGNSARLYSISSDLVDQQSLQRIAQEIQSQSDQYDAVLIAVYDSNQVYYRPGVGPRYLDSGEQYRGIAYQIHIANTVDGEREPIIRAEVGRCVMEKLSLEAGSKTLDSVYFRC